MTYDLTAHVAQIKPGDKVVAEHVRGAPVEGTAYMFHGWLCVPYRNQEPRCCGS